MASQLPTASRGGGGKEGTEGSGPAGQARGKPVSQRRSHSERLQSGSCLCQARERERERGMQPSASESMGTGRQGKRATKLCPLLSERAHPAEGWQGTGGVSVRGSRHCKPATSLSSLFLSLSEGDVATTSPFFASSSSRHDTASLCLCALPVRQSASVILGTGLLAI